MNTEQLIRTLDRAVAQTPTQQRRADALLERIILEPTQSVTGAPSRTPGIRAKSWRVSALLAMGVTVAAVAIVVPGLSPRSAAIASWTPEAEAISTVDLAVAEKACRERLEGTPDAATIPLSISERRGDVVALLFYQESPQTSSSCLADLPTGSDTARDVTAASGGNDGAPLEPAPNSFLKSIEGQSAMGGQVLSVFSGSVGAGVAAITLRGAGIEAQATIADGKYAAWLPGPTFVTNDSDDEGLGLAYDLTLEDGTVILDAIPGAPSNR